MFKRVMSCLGGFQILANQTILFFLTIQLSSYAKHRMTIHCGLLVQFITRHGRTQFFSLIHLILCLRETRNSSNIFIQLSNLYPRLSNWCKFSEQLTSTVLLLPMELQKPAQVVQAATKKIGRKNRKQSTIHGLNVEP